VIPVEHIQYSRLHPMLPLDGKELECNALQRENGTLDRRLNHEKTACCNAKNRWRNGACYPDSTDASVEQCVTHLKRQAGEIKFNYQVLVRSMSGR